MAATQVVKTASGTGLSINGYVLDPGFTAPTPGQTLAWNGSAFIPTNAGGGSTGNWTFTANNAGLTGAASMTFSGNTQSFQFTQIAITGGGVNGFFFAGGAHTNQTASTEISDVNWNLNRVVQKATGALGTQRAFLIQAPTYSFVGASTITTAATFAVTGPPIAGTNATITNPFALWVQSGASVFDGIVYANQGINLGANKFIASNTQAATNTTALTIAPNVVDGASSVGLALNMATAMTSGKMLTLSNNGTLRGSIMHDGFELIIKSETLDLMLRDASNNGFVASNAVGGGYLAVGGANTYGFSSASFKPSTDKASSSGDSTHYWTNVFSYASVTKAQANTVGATFTIDPTAGSYVKQTLTSATNVTAVTISAGTDGQELVVEIIQPAAGTADTVATTWTNVAFAGGVGVFTATLGKRDIYTFIYNATTSKWNEVGRAVNVS